MSDFTVEESMTDTAPLIQDLGMKLREIITGERLFFSPTPEDWA